MKSVGELSQICSQIVLNMLIFGKNCEDLIFYGQWTNLHDRSQNGPKPVRNAWNDWYLTFITHVNTNNIVMWVILVNKCRLGLFQDSDFDGTSWRFEIHFWRNIVHLWKSDFVPISWMCKKQTAVSHSSTESEIISLDAGLRIGWAACSRVMGFDCFCLWKHDSDYRENGETCWHWKKSKISNENQRFE